METFLNFVISFS